MLMNHTISALSLLIPAGGGLTSNIVMDPFDNILDSSFIEISITQFGSHQDKD